MNRAAMNGADDVVLEVRDLRTRFGPERGGIVAVDGVTLRLRRGRTMALVGESGSGKSATALSIMRLIDPPGAILGGSVRYDGRDLLSLEEAEMRHMRGARIGMIFQDPLTSLNPALSIGGQIAVKSRVGAGSRFTVTLPRHVAPVARA